jgi:hypothetical protein
MAKSSARREQQLVHGDRKKLCVSLDENVPKGKFFTFSLRNYVLGFLFFMGLLPMFSWDFWNDPSNSALEAPLYANHH